MPGFAESAPLTGLAFRLVSSRHRRRRRRPLPRFLLGSRLHHEGAGMAGIGASGSYLPMPGVDQCTLTDCPAFS